MATVMQSPTGESLTVADEFTHALKALGWEPVSGPELEKKARRSSPRSRKPAEDEEG